jgi:hypothetical protein
MKTCSKCGKDKELTHFYKARNRYRPECKTCSTLYSKTEKALKRKRKYKLKYYFNTTPEIYEEIYKKQDGKCAICETTVDGFLCVDHCHKTGNIRGLLCKLCNLGIGNLKDDTNLLTKAITYLNLSQFRDD